MLIITPPTIPMTELQDDGPFGVYKCGCGEIFDVDAMTHEGLFLVVAGKYGEPEHTRYLIPQCPKCKRIRLGGTESMK